MRVAAIDIGSNSIRLLVAEVPSASSLAGLVTVARAGEPCRLGRGLGESGLIEAETAERAARLAAQFAERARGLGATRLVVAATAAMRNAANGDQVAALISARCGAPVRILSGEDEARLMYRAVIGGLGRSVKTSSCIVFDLGGGSTEVVSGVGLQPGRWTSLPFGAVSLTEKHLHSNPPSSDEIEALKAEVGDVLMHQCAFMPERAPVLAGVGGTVTVLAMLDRELKSYDPARLEGWGIPADRLLAICDRVCSTTQEERRRWPAMGEGRADIVVAGVLVVSVLMRRFPSPVLVCSTQGLRYGLVRLAAEDPDPAGATA
jgi:exopolyphosphatase/guanosine-5'-triphosphate,3'-diphosphate pyrophosphatase